MRVSHPTRSLRRSNPLAHTIRGPVPAIGRQCGSVRLSKYSETGELAGKNEVERRERQMRAEKSEKEEEGEEGAIRQ